MSEKEEDDGLTPEEREWNVFHVRMGINWDWTYFLAREDAAAFYAHVKEGGYQANLTETDKEFVDFHPSGKSKITIPAGSFCVHWRAKGPTWI